MKMEVSSKSDRAVVLLSGGIDSATTLAFAKHGGYRVYALSIDYGQRHRIELAAARRVATAVGVEQHLVFPIELTAMGGSALTSNIKVPKHRPESQRSAAIPITYVPARNTIFLSVALAWAEAIGAEAIFIGANAIDYSGYPDCRPEFIEAFQKMANLATKASIEGRQIVVQAPLIHLTKAEIIRKGIELGLDYALTSSCYDPAIDGHACGACDSCLIRKKGFAEAGVLDPTRYSQP
jgi:7-cyano-7-deazaguanine synthase